jgi:hypothetical protein
MKILKLLAIVVVLVMVSSSASASGYKSKLVKWTKSNRSYSLKNMDANLIWHATYFSDEFREAQVKYHIKKNHLTLCEADDWREAQKNEQQEKISFFVGFYTKKDYKEFTSDDDSFWHVKLVAENGEIIEPISVAQVPITPYEEMMYPYLNRWSKGYLVTFPKADVGKKFKLSLQSIIESSTLSWKAN